ncbi:greglin-like [Lucilia sericata]|uniref:greglin-like n=1 Tax=Lucilia sericata TaxID=13632 RepID=UPI0018A82D3B|nr:greglin-like [Lucilia sericata]
MYITTFGIILLLSNYQCIMGDCPTICPRILEPVCGEVKNADGETLTCTFENKCELEKFTCNANQDMVVTQEDPCETESEGCYDIIFE